MGGDDALFIVHEAIRSTQRKGARVQCPAWHLGDRVKGAQCWDPPVHSAWELRRGGESPAGKGPILHSTPGQVCHGSPLLLEHQAPPASYSRTRQRFVGKQDLLAAAASQTELDKWMSNSEVIFLFSSGDLLVSSGSLLL